MEKKGASHVDWVISMTIFILGVLILIIFIVPLTNKPLYPKEVLLPIVEKSFQQNYYWTVKKVPLFLGNDQCESVTVFFENGWRLPNGEDSRTEDFPLPNTKLEYFLHNDNLNPAELSMDLRTSPPLPKPCSNNDNVYAGGEHNMVGISNKFLNNLKNSGYNDIKESWNYPLANDFAIYIDNEKIIGGSEAGNLNVFASQYRDYIVDEDGNSRQAVVSLRAW